MKGKSKGSAVWWFGIFTAVLALCFYALSVFPVSAAVYQNPNLGTDQTTNPGTNFEVGEALWSGNTFIVRSRAGGTGILRPLQLTTGANVGILVDSSGNVGIGTSTPAYKLDVVGTLNTDVITEVKGASTSGYGSRAHLYLTSSNNNSVYKTTDLWGGYNYSGAYPTFGINMNSATRLFIDGYSGNVGIATTTPAYGLTVNSTGYFSQPVVVGTPTAANQAATKSYVDSSVATSPTWTVSGTDIYNANSGNVGIGSTTSPTAKLQVSGDYYSPIVVKGNCTGPVTIDWSQGNTQHCVLTGNVTFTFTNGQSGGNYRVVLKQDATGSRTVTWPTTARWGATGLPVLSTAPNATDYVGFIYNGVDSKYDGVAFNSGF